MAEAGKIYPEYSQIEIAEDGTIWLIQNNFDSSSVIEAMEAAATGVLIIDELDLDYIEDYDY